MGLRPTQGNEKRPGPASALYGTVTLSLSSRPKRTGIRSLWNRYPLLVIPTEAKRSGGTCGSADHSWNTE